MGTSLVTLVEISMTLVINIDIVPEKIPGVNGPSSDCFKSDNGAGGWTQIIIRNLDSK